MELYFAPLACSMATRIALYESGKSARFRQVDLREKRVETGADFLAINPLGQVPVLRTDAGDLLSENVAILLHVAETAGSADLSPQTAAERARLVQWLSFISTELHKLVFTPLLASDSNDGARAFARIKITPRLHYLNARLAGRDYLLDRFTVADAYLATVLNWCRFTGIDLAQCSAVATYLHRVQRRPNVARALAEEQALYQAEQARRAA